PSAAVSGPHVSRGRPPRLAVLGVAGAGVGPAAWLFGRPDFGLTSSESFLLLLGSVFVPLVGVFVGDSFVLRRGRRASAEEPRGLRLRPLVPWALGFLVYQWSVPGTL